MTPEQKAEKKWNAQADEFNQWGELDDDEKRELIEKEKPMTTIEILQAAIDEGCEVRLFTTTPSHTKVVNVEIEGPTIFGYATEPTLETAVAAAWQHYQTNKNQ